MMVSLGDTVFGLSAFYVTPTTEDRFAYAHSATQVA